MPSILLIVSPACRPLAALTAFSSNLATVGVPIRSPLETMHTMIRKPRIRFITAPAATTNSLAPTLFLEKEPLSSGILILALHSAVTAKQDPTQGIFRCAFCERKNLRPHADRKFVYLDLHEPGGNKMTALMDNDDQFKKQDRNQDWDRWCSKLNLNSLDRLTDNYG